ncbi:MAG: PilZ domain-containing protein [Desulfobacterales bacterium]
MDLTSERRDNTRYRFDAFIWHTNILPGIFYKAKLYNLSESGIYFETDQSLYPGEKIYIAKKSDSSISNRKEFKRIKIKWQKDNIKSFDEIEIKWRQELEDSFFQYGYGAVFTGSNTNMGKILDKDEVRKRNNGNRALEYKKDPREITREDYRQEITFISRNQSYKGLISNISRVGAFIETKNRFSIGQLIHLEIPGDILFKDLKLRGLVVRIEPDGIGVKFDRRTGLERRKDLDRRRGPDRRTRGKRRDKSKKR